MGDSGRNRSFLETWAQQSSLESKAFGGGKDGEPKEKGPRPAPVEAGVPRGQIPRAGWEASHLLSTKRGTWAARLGTWSCPSSTRDCTRWALPAPWNHIGQPIPVSDRTSHAVQPAQKTPTSTFWFLFSFFQLYIFLKLLIQPGRGCGILNFRCLRGTQN